jgi:NADPH:quinone reductase-like Zn-dependent oxidoreductase
MLARAFGHNAFYCAGNSVRREYLESLGIQTIDQSSFERFVAKKDVIRFRGLTKKLTSGVGMHIVCDMFRGAMFEAGLAALARGGVDISSGWQLQNEVTYPSAALSLRQITLDHAHVETMYAPAAVLSLFGRVFRPLIHPEIYSFEELPRAIEELRRSEQNGLAVIRVARDLPGAVAPLVPT